MIPMELTNSSLRDILNDFEQFTSKPESFVSTKGNISELIKQFLKRTYDVTKTEEIKSQKSSALPELIIQNFDEEQIFQQIELQNDVLLNSHISKVSKLAVAKSRLVFTELVEDVQNDEHTEPSNEVDKSDVDDADNDEDDEGEENSTFNNTDEDDNYSGNEEDDDEKGTDNEHSDDGKNKRKFKPSVVDDAFFKLNEMNDFVISQEQEKPQKKKKVASESDSESDDEDIDMFQASENEEEENDLEGNDKQKNPRYKDFFAKRGTKNKIDDAIANIDDTEYMSAVKSNLELREERLKKKIDEIEDAAVSEKPWQLKGEVTAENRPVNSLLEEVLEFDLTTRPAPVITEETTYILEDVIKQRIKDKAFDDVERKQKPVDTPLEYKKKLILDQEKGKESLAQIYEKEYIKQKEALNTDQSEKEEVEPKLHQEIKTMMNSLFRKLDALSNFHFTPKPAAPELRIISNLPAISMEEVAPVASSDAALLAPEEVKSKVNGDIVGKGERTRTDKKRERRKKKQKQRVHAHEKKKKEIAVNKLRPGLGNKYSKEKVKKMLDIVTKDANVNKMNHTYSKKIKSSTAFFSQLQDNVTSQIKSQVKDKPKDKNKKQKNIKQYKL